ncbi:hypothetical protein HC028_14375 [Planosporangium flavigriseum]|uniref:Cyanate hydratase N-terminal domain-containing protein n=1 Tax=Planosporangium flavigriseum TaxID=373681 RepID=A0A8J3LNT1_9ACTN|nr:hypothetical protein [Planosporangium flavigriseum]NJC65675.1 hypothetical protein [Planosporangium flavigriseum]GIG76538.1 hypothetical protein Pfl04_49420 [Planosporangium flavigriseum]
MTREEITQSVLAAKLARGLSWQDLADAISKPVAWVVAALFGQRALHPADAAALATKLGLPECAALAMAAPAGGGPATAVSKDPAVDRVYEVLWVYGPR